MPRAVPDPVRSDDLQTLGALFVGCETPSDLAALILNESGINEGEVASARGDLSNVKRRVGDENVSSTTDDVGNAQFAVECAAELVRVDEYSPTVAAVAVTLGDSERR